MKSVARWVVAGVGLLASSAQAESLVASLSSDTIAITSNFTGAELTLFGAIERDALTISRSANYDVVVSVRGPRGLVNVREKKQWGPFWLNLNQRKYIAVPAYISILTNRPLETIASPELRARLHMGVENLVTPQGDKNQSVDAEEPGFRAALIRLRREQKLFGENGKAVTFFGANLFRSTLRMPGGAPLGNYDVDVALFADGVPLAKTSTSFTVIKSGAEQTITDASRNQAAGYGIGTAALALLLGWLATLIFRRD